MAAVPSWHRRYYILITIKITNLIIYWLLILYRLIFLIIILAYYYTRLARDFL